MTFLVLETPTTQDIENDQIVTKKLNYQFDILFPDFIVNRLFVIFKLNRLFKDMISNSLVMRHRFQAMFPLTCPREVLCTIPYVFKLHWFYSTHYFVKVL
jgi:hypothetical protein